MSRLTEIDAEIERLTAERAEEMKKTRVEVLADVKEKIKTYRLTPTELKSVLKPLRVRKAKEEAEEASAEEAAAAAPAPAKKAAARKKAAKAA